MRSHVSLICGAFAMGIVCAELRMLHAVLWNVQLRTANTVQRCLDFDLGQNT